LLFLVTTILLFKFRLLQETQLLKIYTIFFLESHKVKVNKNRGHFTVHTLSRRLESCFLAAEDETLADCEQVPEDRQREVAGRSLLLAATAVAVVIVVVVVVTVVAADSGDQGFDFVESFAESVVVVAAVAVGPEAVAVAVVVAVVVAVAVVEAVAAEPEAVVVVASAAGVQGFLDGAAE
jgi:hypothetical protein